MYLLLDECCPKSLVGIAEELGHSAQRTIEVGVLGRQASDAAIFDFAYAVGAVIVTVNRGDFIALAMRRPGHPGLIVLPSVPPALMRRFFRTVLHAAPADVAMTGHISVVDTAGRIRIIEADDASA